jgi:hypothetical protein
MGWACALVLAFGYCLLTSINNTMVSFISPLHLDVFVPSQWCLIADYYDS